MPGEFGIRCHCAFQIGRQTRFWIFQKWTISQFPFTQFTWQWSWKRCLFKSRRPDAYTFPADNPRTTATYNACVCLFGRLTAASFVRRIQKWIFMNEFCNHARWPPFSRACVFFPHASLHISLYSPFAPAVQSRLRNLRRSFHTQ